MRQDNIVTSAGVSAGLDLALWLAGEIGGEGRAKAIQLAIEYDPQPPFDSGHMSKASATTKAAATALLSRDSVKPANMKAPRCWRGSRRWRRCGRAGGGDSRICRRPSPMVATRIPASGRYPQRPAKPRLRSPPVRRWAAGSRSDANWPAGLQPGGRHAGRIAVGVVDVLLAGEQAVPGVDQPGPVREPEGLTRSGPLGGRADS